MRVTQNMLTQQFLYNLSNINQQISQDQEEMSTGKALNEPSDNPLAVSQDMAIQATLSQTTAYQSTINTALSWMQNSSTSVQSIISSLQSIQDNVNEALNATSSSPAQLQSLADVTQQLVDQINNDADTQQGSQYLFGGTQVTTAPTSMPPGVLVNQSAFDDAGVGTGTGGVTQSSGTSTIVSSLSDPDQLLQSGQSYSLVFDASSIGSDGSIQSGTITLEAAGVTVASATIPSGTALGASITLQAVSGSGTMQLSLGDMFEVSPSAKSGMSYQQTDTITPTNGFASDINFQVSKDVNVPVNLTAAQMFRTVPTSGTSDLQSTLTQTVSDLKTMATDLQSSNSQGDQGDLTNLQSDLSNLTANLNQVIDMNAELGSRIQSVTAIQTQMSQYSNTLTDQQNNLVNANMAQVITKFSTDQTVYEAALQMGAQVLLPTLVSYLPSS